MRNNILLFIIPVLLMACDQTKQVDKESESNAVEKTKRTEHTPMVEGEPKRLEEVKDSLLQELNEKIRAAIDQADLYLRRSSIYERFGDLSSAEADLERAYAIDSTSLPVLIAHSDYYLRRGELNPSLAYLKQARYFHPEAASVYLKMGELYLIGKNNRKSLQQADLAIKYDMYNAQAYFLKGFNFLELGDTLKAISSFQTTVEQDPEHFEAYMQLGLLNSIKKDSLAIDYFENALEVKPHDKEAMYGIAMFQQENEMYNEALKTYHEILKHHPNFREAHYNLGYVHMYYLQLYRQASLHFSDAIEVDPNYYQAYYNRGYCFELLGDINNAIKDYQKSLSIQPDYDLAANGISRVKDGI